MGANCVQNDGVALQPVALPVRLETATEKRDRVDTKRAAGFSQKVSRIVQAGEPPRPRRTRPKPACSSWPSPCACKTSEMKGMKEPSDERSSEPHQPRVMRRHPQGWG